MKTLIWTLLALGTILLGINIVGLFKSMRNPEVYAEDYTTRVKGVEMKYEDVKKEIARKENESDKAFALRINDVVHEGTMHYWHREGAKKYYLTVPLWENYILSVYNKLKSVDRYEFCNYKKNLERGVGLCSTHSIIVKGILGEHGIESRLWDLTRHVVVEAKVGDDEWYVLDPNYGLYVPYAMEAIKANPELVRASYKDMADLYKKDTVLYKDPYTTDFMVEIFGYEESRVYTKNARFERFSYAAIWILPLLLLSAGSLLFVKKK